MNAGHNYSSCKHYVAKKQIVLTLFDMGGGGGGEGMMTLKMFLPLC